MSLREWKRWEAVERVAHGRLTMADEGDYPPPGEGGEDPKGAARELGCVKTIGFLQPRPLSAGDPASYMHRC